jgi:Ca2+-transporting ATPase
MAKNNFNLEGLNSDSVMLSRAEHGANKLESVKENRFFIVLKSILKEPMVILLLVASVIYFGNGKIGDAIFLAATIVLVAGISIYQAARSRTALENLKNIIQPNSKVIRNGIIEEIKSEELVIGDSLLVEEGNLVAADGLIVQSNDFSVNESILTGESFVVSKDKTKEDNFIFQGTTVSSGLAIATISAIGHQTRLGKIGKSLEGIKEEKTPLELQIGKFVKKMVIAGALVFMIVWSINYFQSRSILDSLLKALTLAMSILPEEIPVAFTTFMALGAWRLMKMGIVVKQMKTVETLGSATVICADKTGTITENIMSLAKLYVFGSKQISNAEGLLSEEESALVRLSMWSSEPIPFDPMEIALHRAYTKLGEPDERLNYQLVHEYPLGGKPPMMTHVFENTVGKRIIAAKGAPEALLKVSELNSVEKEQVERAINTLAKEGYRLLGVGETAFDGGDFPTEQQSLKFKFRGLVAFYDPPKTNIPTVLKSFYRAGIKVKIITGDNAETTSAVAKEIGFIGFDKTITGEELMDLKEEELNEKVAVTQIFSRMFPDAKLRVINALKANQEIVAMTGDGVNDGPALKAAHIGIAMGKKGTEIAKQAASLILVEDDLSKMVDAIAMGRKIYTNLKKALQYIISIHIPIILTVFVPLALGWCYPNIFSPLHIIFLELIMGPTCSIIYENEPMERNTMEQKPRSASATFFSRKELANSIAQGLMITAGTLFTYQLSVSKGYGESLTRAMVFTVLITANMCLTLVNRSFYYSIFSTLKYKNNMVLLIIVITFLLSASVLYFKPLSNFFAFEMLSPLQLITCIAIGIVAVIWFEGVKGLKRYRSKRA